MTDPFLTLEEAAAMLGGTERPFSRDTIERLIAHDRLQDNGARRKLRRVLRSSVDALIRDIAEGGSLWRASEKITMGKGRSMNTRKARDGGLQLFPTGTAKSPRDGPLVAKRPRRSDRNS